MTTTVCRLLERFDSLPESDLLRVRGRNPQAFPLGVEYDPRTPARDWLRFAESLLPGRPAGPGRASFRGRGSSVSYETVSFQCAGYGSVGFLAL